MATFFLIVIFCVITAFITFTVTRSLYINRFRAWYQEEVAAMPFTSTEQLDLADGEAKKMDEVLLERYTSIYRIDPKIVPQKVINLACGYEGRHFRSDIYDLFTAARWLGYDFQLVKRELPPPPQFKHRPTPKELRTELVECWDAEARLEGIDIEKA